MTDCPCFTAPLGLESYTTSAVGIDVANGRFGEVTSMTCRRCGTRWLHYFVEYEATTSSGRWFMGAISEEQAAALTPDSALTVLERLPWYYVGGSYFPSGGGRRSGRAAVDL